MADVELSYKGSTIGSMSASGSLTLETAGKYCEDDIEVEYTKPSGPTPTGTKNITISGPGTTTEDVTNYANAAITVPAGSAATPATTVPANPTISVDANGLITAAVNASQNITPSVSPGYVSAGTPGAVTASGSNTSQLPTQAAQTITPTTTDQTIASGRYLTGTQTIKGDANLLPENIVNGVTIFGVIGTAQGGGGGDMYDIVIKCTNANGFSNTASDYVVETGSFDAIATKVYNGDKIDGIVYCRRASYDDEDEYWTYGYDILRIFAAGMTGDSGWWEGLGLTFRGDTVTGVAGSRYTLRRRTLYVIKANDDPDMSPSFTYQDESQFIYTP